jgi:MFS superfamily sulfate permease-like transporter
MGGVAPVVMALYGIFAGVFVLLLMIGIADWTSFISMGAVLALATAVAWVMAAHLARWRRCGRRGTVLLLAVYVAAAAVTVTTLLVALQSR